MFLSDRWLDYELIDTGDGEKLERYGSITMTRPEPAAIWPHQPWPAVDAVYTRSATGGGSWALAKKLPARWRIGYDLVDQGPRLVFSLENMSFKHTGVFPEQAANWDFLYRDVRRLQAAGKSPRLLNLFAYTGGASLAMAAAQPAEVVHVDAAKGMLERAKINQQLSHLADVTIRYLADDVEKFVRRELRRGRRYDGIVLDPPTYGRGPNGEMWRIEDKLATLLDALRALLNDGPAFLVLNTYSGFSVRNVQTLVDKTLFALQGDVEVSELALPVTRQNGALSLGITARWTR